MGPSKARHAERLARIARSRRPCSVQPDDDKTRRRDLPPTGVVDLVFDVGAHLGHDTAFYARKGFRVVAIEADPKLAAALSTAVFEQGLAETVTVVSGAVTADRRAEVHFYRNRVNDQWGTTSQLFVERNARKAAPSEQLTVRALVLGDLVARYGVPYFMKVDIEGSEPAVLAAMGSWPSRPVSVSMELPKESFVAAAWFVVSLYRLGYRRFRVVSQRRLPRHVRLGREGRAVVPPSGRGVSGTFGRELTGWIPGWLCAARLLVVSLGYRLWGDDPPGPLRGPLALVRRRGLLLPQWHDLHAR